MGKKDPRIDAYIAKAADFAKPILNHFRVLVHKACPEVEEKMKWSFPHFDYKGEMMCSMAAFKQHCAFSFWKAALMKDVTLIDNAKKEEAMGHLGKVTSLKDLPSDTIITGYIKEAVKLNDEGKKVTRIKTRQKKDLTMPEFLINALKKNKEALATFESFNFTNKKEYVEWIIEAKTELTRHNRLAQAIEWMAEGKIRHWKYAK